ncbi:hypothetical protein C8J29_104387 [Cereibacter johrii]|uniref:Iron-containing alcohol dehydrogenase-like protein n=1 Tax=Cereibacter johrii TaxID=445629 RepID=A0ABX5J6A6_9RHOB|nr:hypothetical protein C8J29_104387 [Cereibacter johrii]
MRLRAHGVPPEDLPVMAAEAHGIRRLIDWNPPDLSVAEIEAIYRLAYRARAAASPRSLFGASPTRSPMGLAIRALRRRRRSARASLPSQPPVRWRPIGSIIGRPLTGSVSVRQGSPKTACTISSVRTVSGGPLAWMRPPAIATSASA